MDASPILADPAALTRRAAALIEAGRMGAARPLLAAVRRMALPSSDLARVSARLAIREGRLQDASDELDAAVAAAPADASLRITRAELRIQTDDPAGAARDAAEAVTLDRGDVAAKALLGVALLELGRARDAAACLDEAARMDPANQFLHQALAAAHEAQGDVLSAEVALARGIAACPGATALRNAAILLCIRRGDLAGAMAQAEAARRAGAVDACVLGLQGHTLSSLGRHDEAAAHTGTLSSSHPRIRTSGTWSPPPVRCRPPTAPPHPICAPCSTATRSGSRPTCSTSATACRD